jgi:hypothetical protein
MHFTGISTGKQAFPIRKIKAYFMGEGNIYNVSYYKTITDFQFDEYQDLLTQKFS